MLLASINNSLNELAALLSQLSDSEYSKPCPELSQATIGEHTRHIVEMFQCLVCQYELGVINYDSRKRDITIQSHTSAAIDAIGIIREKVGKPDKKLLLQQTVDGENISIESNYNRELLYNLVHCIHHQALIKVAILKYGNVVLDINFGVARSTIEYRNQCAQ